MNLMGIPDQLASDYGEADGPVIRHPSSMRVVPNQQSQYSGSAPQNPYAQYGKTPDLSRKSNGKGNGNAQPQPYPIENIQGYEMQMINGLPNGAPLAIDQVSPTPFNRGDFDPVYNVSGKPYDWSKGPTYGNPYGNPYGAPQYPNAQQYHGAISDAFTQGVPNAPIGEASSNEERMVLGQALAFVGIITAPTDNWAALSSALKTLQTQSKIAVTGTYDEATKQALGSAFTSKRGGGILQNVWNTVSGYIPGANAPAPSTEVYVPKASDSSDSSVLKYGLIAAGIIAALVGLGLYLRNRDKE